MMPGEVVCSSWGDTSMFCLEGGQTVNTHQIGFLILPVLLDLNSGAVGNYETRFLLVGRCYRGRADNILHDG